MIRTLLLTALALGAVSARADDLIAKGEYLTRAADCAGCHTGPSGLMYTGGRAFTLPMGTVYAAWTGIGAAGGLFWGIAMEGEPLTAVRVVCVCFILAGVAGLKFGS